MIARIAYQIPSFLQRLYGGVVWRGDRTRKTVYLTFDDGCIPEVTPQVLEILNHYGVKATFFCVGNNIEKHAALLQDILQRGHQAGNHTFSHLKGIKTQDEAYFDSIRQTDQLLDRFHPLAERRPHLFRPPYGKMKLSQKKHLQRTHTIVLWDLITHDYDPAHTPEQIMEVIRKYVRSGSVIVFHDSLKAAPNMLQVLPRAIEYLQAQGYSFETLK